MAFEYFVVINRKAFMVNCLRSGIAYSSSRRLDQAVTVFGCFLHFPLKDFIAWFRIFFPVPVNALLKIRKSFGFVRYAIFFNESFTVEKTTSISSLFSFFFRQNLHKVCLSYFVVCFVYSDFWSVIKMQNSFTFSLFISTVSQIFDVRYWSLVPPGEHLA